MKKIFGLLISLCIAVAVLFIAVFAVRCLKSRMTGIDNRPAELHISICDADEREYLYANYNEKLQKPALSLNGTYILDIDVFPGNHWLSYELFKIDCDKNAVELNLVTDIAADTNEEISFKKLRYTVRGLKAGSTIIEISHHNLKYGIEVNFS